MNTARRKPYIAESLRMLLDKGVPVKSVLDVGIREHTPALKQVFPEIPHHLFEPVDAFFDVIRENYANLNYTLHQVALSDSDGIAWQIGISLDGSGNVTHSRLSDVPVTTNQESKLVSCKSVSMKRLDGIVKTIRPEVPYLLKIDVDGHELPILKGAEESLKDASIVVIEAPLTRGETAVPKLMERATFLSESGFYLIDIGDFVYYYGLLSQVDLVFVSRGILEKNEDLRPWETKPYASDQWVPY